MPDFLFIKGFFDTVDLFSDEMIKVFSLRGFNCGVLHRLSMNQDVKKLLTDTGSHKPKGVIVFNNLGFSMGEEEGANIWDSLDIPYVDILMDHPFHFQEILKRLPKNAKVFCIDRNHVSYIREYYPNISFVDFLPHAGCMYAVDELHDTPDRDIDILYAGNLSRVLIETLIPDFDSFRDIDGADFSQKVLNRLIMNPHETTESVIVSELGKKENWLQGKFNHRLSREEILSYINAFRFTDGFAVSFFRELAVRVLVENGFKVHVLGLGWETCDWADNENLILLGKVSARDVLSYMKRSRIVLNTLTWFKQGTHDRIPNGLLAGALPLTDSSGYLNEIFVDGTDIATFELRQISTIPDIAEKYLKDDDLRLQVVESGVKKVRSSHTWESRTEDILRSIS